MGQKAVFHFDTDDVVDKTRIASRDSKKTFGQFPFAIRHDDVKALEAIGSRIIDPEGVTQRVAQSTSTGVRGGLSPMAVGSKSLTEAEALRSTSRLANRVEIAHDRADRTCRRSGSLALAAAKRPLQASPTTCEATFNLVKFMAADRSSLEFRRVVEERPDERPILIYLPGLDGTGRLLHRQPQLYDTYQVRCVSYPQDNVHSYADLVALAIKALETTAGGTVLAESFGGAVALMTALERPDLVRRMVLVNTFAYFPRRAVIELLAGLGRYLPAKPSSPATRPVRGFFFFSPDIPAAEQQEWWNRTADTPMHTFGRRFELIAGLDLRPRLAEIQIPVLVVAAPDDRVVPPCAGRTLARLLPHARLIEPRVGHAALVHPRLNVAELLQTSRYWDDSSVAATAASSAGSRSG